MRFLRSIAAVGLCLFLLGGCSEKTKQESKEMLNEAGDAAGSAVEDTKTNIKKSGEVFKAADDKAREVFSEPGATPAATDVDADGVPDSQETKP